MPASSSTRPVPFIEPKWPDWQAVRRYLQPSDNAHHWANFGPASCALEAAIAAHLRLPPDRKVISCASGTSALTALVGAHAYQARRRLRWVVSAYGFCSTRLGIPSDALVADCDATGMLDLKALNQLDPSGYDGVIVTNLFGFNPDLSRYRAICAERSRIILVDNALGFDSSYDHGSAGAPDEIISLHQTKPWGIGEGGCAIVSAQLEPVVRALTNFGVGLDERAAPYSANAKISDYASALHLDRLHRGIEVFPEYRAQAERVWKLGSRAGLKPLCNDMNHAAQTIAHVP